MSIKSIDDWAKPGALIPTGSHLQQPVDVIRDLARQVALITQTEAREPQERFLAKVVKAPSQSSGSPSADYTDARYGLQRIFVPGADPDKAVDFQDDDNDDVSPIVTGTNTAEWKAGTHTLPTDGSMVVEVLGWWDSGDPQQTHYFFWALPPGAFMVQCTKDGGVAGSMTSSASCTFTYALKDNFGITIAGATGLTPKRTRYSNCAYDLPPADSWGLAFYDGSGAIQLADVFAEKPTGTILNSITSYQIDGATYKYQYKKTAALVLDKANEDTSWTDAITGEPCPS
jgi:hypothetical protein